MSQRKKETTSQNLIYDTIIVGAGASGLYCAAHLHAGRVLVLEKNKKVGIKILASGSGQCNLTHAGYINAFYTKYGDKKAFVKPALSAHDNQKVMQFFEREGLTLVTREDGKVFPKSFKASDVVEVLRRACEKNHIEILLNQTVLQCERQEDVNAQEPVFKVTTEEGAYFCHNLVMATGGKSYQGLGTTGDGYRFAEALGHTIRPLKPGLTGIVTKSKVLVDLQGLSLEEVQISHPKIKKASGPMVLTHFGLSGPVIINNSRDFDRGDQLTINLLSVDKNVFETQFLDAVKQHGEKPLAYFMNQVKCPDALKQRLLEVCELKGDMKLAEIDKHQRKVLIQMLTEYPVDIESLIGFNQAMVTVGGVSCDDVDPKTLSSKRVKGLYLLGEVVDVDGDTGGYNLQWAFSSGFAAAKDITGRAR